MGSCALSISIKGRKFQDTISNDWLSQNDSECLVSLRSVIDTVYKAIMCIVYYRWHLTVGFDF